MSAAALATPRTTERLDTWHRIPWQWQALILFGASRVVTTALFLWVGSQATSQSRAGAHPSLLDLESTWDGYWYRVIALVGYPHTLPRTADGLIDTNQWAFLPLYPETAKLLSLGVDAAWPAAAVLLSIACGFASAVLLAVLLRPHIGAGRATFAVAVFAFSPLSFMLQTTYAESMGIMLSLAALCLVDRGRYLLAVPVAVLLAFTRPGVLALALTVGVQLLLRMRDARRLGRSTPRVDLVAGSALVVVCVLAGFAWPLLAGAVTGVPDAYVRTELAWRALWMGPTDLHLFTPWIFAIEYWWQQGGGSDSTAVAGPVLFALLVVLFVGVLLLPPVRRLGRVARLWCASYGLYLLAVFFPQSSVFRLLMPLAPLAGALTPTRLVPRALVLTASVALQALWLWVTYGPIQTYWSVP